MNPEAEAVAGYARLRPGDSEIPVKARVFLELYEQAKGPTLPEAERLGTVADLVRRYGCSPSTGRSWLAQGWVPGAHRLGKLGWRFQLNALPALDQRLRSTPSDGTADLGSWRARKGHAA